MAPPFTARANYIFGLFMLAFIVGVPLVIGLVWSYNRSSYGTGRALAIEQPIPFSHQHHVGGLAIDCRYCHLNVETSGFAGMPSSDICMSCHSEIWTEADQLATLRESWRTAQPIGWQRVYDLPDFTYFDHSIHIAKGVGCETCHGRIDRMPLTYKAVTLWMKWCLDCHRDPAPHLRPQSAIYELGWKPPATDQRPYGEGLLRRYGIRSRRRLLDCTACHR